jgi:hypothetical protein
VSIDNTFTVGDGFDINSYDFIINTSTVCLLFSLIQPILLYASQLVHFPQHVPAMCFIAGAMHFFYCVIVILSFLSQASGRKNERKFTFNVCNFVSSTQCVAGHHCILPASNRRFADKVPLGKIIHVAGTICSPAISAHGDERIKHISVEVTGISFLSTDFIPLSPSNV